MKFGVQIEPIFFIVKDQNSQKRNKKGPLENRTLHVCVAEIVIFRCFDRIDITSDRWKGRWKWE